MNDNLHHMLVVSGWTVVYLLVGMAVAKTFIWLRPMPKDATVSESFYIKTTALAWPLALVFFALGCAERLLKRIKG